VSAGLPTYVAIGGGYDVVVSQQAALAIWWAIGLGFALGVLPRGRPVRGAFLPLVAVAGLVVWTGLSLSWTDSQERTLAELARVLGYAGVAVLALTALDRRTWRAAAAGLAVALVAVTVLAVGSRVAPGIFPDDEIARALASDRLSYPLGYWNGVGAWAAMTIAVAVGWSCHGKSAAARASSLAVAPVAGLVVYLTYSRGATASAVIAMIAVVVLSRNRWTAAVHAAVSVALTGAVIAIVRGQPAIAEGTGGEGGAVVALALVLAAAGCGGTAVTTRNAGLDGFRASSRSSRFALAAALAAVVAFAFVLGSGAVSSAREQFSEDGYPAADGDPAARLASLESSRGAVWSSAIAAFGSDPLRGIGAGTFEFWWGRDAERSEDVRDAHSLYVESLAELGVPGLLLTLAFLGGLLRLALLTRIEARRSGAAAASAAFLAAFVAFLVQAGVDWMWELTAIGLVAIGGASVLVAAQSRPRTRRPRLTKGRVAIVALAALAGVVQIPGIVSTQRVRASDRSLAIGLESRARELADDAVSAQPWAASPYAQRALVSESEGLWEAARADALEAIAREPTNWRHRVLLARIEARSGDKAAALAALEAAARLRAGASVDRAFLEAEVDRLAGGE